MVKFGVEVGGGQECGGRGVYGQEDGEEDGDDGAVEHWGVLKKRCLE